MLRVDACCVLAGLRRDARLTDYGYAGVPQGVADCSTASSSSRELDDAGQYWRHPTPGVEAAASHFPGLPKGFIPSQDMGYLLVNIQLPDSASLGADPERDRRRCKRSRTRSPGVDATVGVAGQSLLLNAFGSNFGTMFLMLEAVRRSGTTPDDLYYEADRRTSCASVRFPRARSTDADRSPIFGPPPVRGRGPGRRLHDHDRGPRRPRARRRCRSQTENDRRELANAAAASWPGT